MGNGELSSRVSFSPFPIPNSPFDQVPGVGIEPTPPGSEPGITTSSDCPGAKVGQARGEGIEPSSPGSKPGIVTNSDYPAVMLEDRIVKDRNSRAPGATRTRVTADHRFGWSPQCEILAARRPVLFTIYQSVEPEGLEPSPAWLRARDAAANTLVPSRFKQSARRELNPRPASYKDAALTVELRASAPLRQRK